MVSVADTPPTPLGVRLCLAILYLAHLVLAAWTPQPNLDLGMLVAYVLSALGTTQYCLVAMAMVLPTGARTLRITSALAAILLLLLPSDGWSTESYVGGSAAVFRLMEFVPALAICLFLRKSGLTIRRLRASETNLPRMRVRFHVSDIMFATTIVAAFVACLKFQSNRWIGDSAISDYPRNQLIALYATVYVTIVAAAFLALWSALGVTHPIRRLLIAVGIFTAISIVDQLFSGQTPGWKSPVYAVALMFPAMLSLLVVRWCGYRLAPYPPASCPAEPAP